MNQSIIVTKPIALVALAALALAGSLALAADSGDAGFEPLFDGKDLTGWKLRHPEAHNSWSILPGGVLKNTVNPGTHGVDLVTTKKFWNFTVRYEYMTPKDSNSGFYLRGRHEIQILGDYDSGKATDTCNGSIYGFKAPDKFVTKPAGEWQTVEATIIGNRITVILNGVKIHDNVECNRATGSEIDDKVNEPGPIFLQGDHGTVSFRNIRIKELPKA
jgi:3-keto-disaccharide hydrolase